MRWMLLACLFVMTGVVPVRAADDGFKPHDEFYWLEEMNRASAVMVVEEKIVTPELGRTIAASIETTARAGDLPGGKRPDVGQYLTLEKDMIAAGGPDVTRVHSGRSRQDLIATANRLKLREHLLEYLARLNTVRQDLLALAALHRDTIIPAYTNGVQAQPTTLAHYLLGYEAALARDASRVREAYARLNLSPLGAAALGGSSFPIDRQRLAGLLGFDGVVDNTFDANLVSSLDVPLEAQDIAESSSLTLGALIEDIELQYHESQPWLLLREGDLTGPSSIMPQKRNPYGLIYVRRDASQVVADADLFRLSAHNLASGMLDYKHGPAEQTVDDAILMMNDMHRVLSAVVIDPARSLAEVNGDYSTTTELADILQRDANVPFRIGHHFASELVSYGRAHGLTPAQLPYTEAQRIFTVAAASFGMKDAQLPLSEARFHEALTPENMVGSARVQGGPQPHEVERMQKASQDSLAEDGRWLIERRERLAAAHERLSQAFSGLEAVH